MRPVKLVNLLGGWIYNLKTRLDRVLQRDKNNNKILNFNKLN